MFTRKHPFMTKTFNKKEIKGKFLYLIKNISNKPKDNIILNGKNLDAFPLRSRTQKACFFSLLIFNSIAKDLPNTIREGNKRFINWERKK